ncbi:hypothetical protein Btru_026258 [Bulinus truncatus]|nr:hypothetical protein Btru_026258 [Bulinus truncatus]
MARPLCICPKFTKEIKLSLIHRGLAITIVILTTAGLVCIFAHYGPAIRKTAVPHAYVGLTVVTASYVQVLCGLFRPSLDHKKRWIFNWVHRLLGYTTHTLAAVTIFLAFKIKYFPENLARVGEISVICWITVQLIWHLIFQVFTYNIRKQRNPEVQALADSGRYQSVWLALVVVTHHLPEDFCRCQCLDELRPEVRMVRSPTFSDI